MNNISHNRSILTHAHRIVRVGAEGLQNKKFYALLMALTVLAATLCARALMDGVTIRGVGQISTSAVVAASGYWGDIQDAINAVVAAGGKGNVTIPEGTWDFVNVNEDWSGARVVIPAGVNVFGASTLRTSGLPYDGVGQNPNDQVVDWRTVLVLPWDVPGTTEKSWFRIWGTSDPNKPSRFSDIKLVGYRTGHEGTSTAMQVGVRVGSGNEGGVINFRVDHCYFLNTCGAAVYAMGSDLQNGPDTVCGVVDHCIIRNTAGVPAPYDTRTVDYGVQATRGAGWEFTHEPWEDTSNVLGQYTNYSVYVEDCYFEKWRHCTVARNGGHVVFRHNTVQYDYAYGSVDIHGDAPGRALEVYNNKLLDPVGFPGWSSSNWQVITHRAGAGAIFNNTVTGYEYFVVVRNGELDIPQFWVHDLWIWDNTLPAGVPIATPSGDATRGLPAPIEGTDYFFYAPHTFNYEPYPYPHPLTLGTALG